MTLILAEIECFEDESSTITPEQGPEIEKIQRKLDIGLWAFSRAMRALDEGDREGFGFAASIYDELGGIPPSGIRQLKSQASWIANGHRAVVNSQQRAKEFRELEAGLA